MTPSHRMGLWRALHLVTGMLLMAAGLFTFAMLADPDGGYLSVLPGILLLGAGVGLSMSPSTAAITASLPEEKQGALIEVKDGDVHLRSPPRARKDDHAMYETLRRAARGDGTFSWTALDQARSSS